jgi:hypothetical protein
MRPEFEDLPNAAALRARLRHVYWLGGGSGAGKSTIAQRIAAEHEMLVYATGDAMPDHSRVPTHNPDTQPLRATQAPIARAPTRPASPKPPTVPTPTSFASSLPHAARSSPHAAHSPLAPSANPPTARALLRLPSAAPPQSPLPHTWAGPQF